LDGEFQGSGSGMKIQVPVQVVGSGVHSLELLTMTLGLVNFGPHMEQWARGIQGPVAFGDENITAEWEMQPGLLGEFYQLYTTAGSGIVHWRTDVDESVKRAFTWFKMDFDFPELKVSQGPFALDLIGMNKGFAWVNGHGLGRYWLLTATGDCSACNYTGPYNPWKCRVGCGQPSQRYYHVPADWLLPTNNLIVLFEELGGDVTNVSLVQRNGGIVCGEVTVNSTADSAIDLKCPPDSYISKIDFASFGNPTGSCGSFELGSCNSQDTAAVVKTLCTGNSECNIAASTLIFGDPCPDVAKMLAVQVLCTSL